MPRPACGAAPPRWHTTWPILPHRHASPPPQSDTTGTSKTPCTTRVTLPSRKINPASVTTRVSSHGSEASPIMCYAVTEPALSVRTDTPQPSPDSTPWLGGASVESIEQPCDSGLVIVKLLDPDARGLHQYMRQCQGDFVSLGSLQFFETVAAEQQAHLPTRYRRRQVARLHRHSPERIHYRSETLGAFRP